MNTGTELKHFLTPNRLFPDEAIEEAISFTAEELKKDEYAEARPVVNFSGGKDSFLTLCVVMKALERIGRPERPVLISSFSGYENNDFRPWFNFLLEGLYRRFPSIVVTKNVLASYSCETLGLGFPPTYMPNLRQCNSRWKVLPIDTGYDEIKKRNPGGIVCFAGTRAEESVRRAHRFAAKGRAHEIGTGHFLIQPLAWVKEANLWPYLSANMEEITGVPFAALSDYYATKTRDGCWCCSYCREVLPPFQRFATDYARQAWENRAAYGWETETKEEAKIKRPVYAAKCMRFSLEGRKRAYKDITEAAERFGVRDEYFTPIIEDIIAEEWNYCEYFADRFGKFAGMRHWNAFKDEYLSIMKKPYLLPEVFTITKKKNGGEYHAFKKGNIFFNNLD